MCGIAGLVAPTGEPHVGRETLARMIHSLQHRGPDDRGVYLDRRCGLGATRLSIIDLAGGHQPMQSPDGAVVLAWNGELYNYREVRECLRQAGREFRTQSDTEVLVQAYATYGVEAFTRLHGMFAAAIWDVANQELILVRDRLGVKPLFYATIGHAVVFGSELKAILESGWIDPQVDPRALSRFLSVGYTPGPESILHGIVQLPPGHYLRVTAGGSRLVQWWDAPRPAVYGETITECVEQVRTRLDAAIERHLVSDVPVGLLLSGGLDSTTILHLMAGRTGQPVRTFTVGFEEPSFDESREARATAKGSGAVHEEVLCTPRYLREHLESIVLATDNLLANPAAIPLHCVTALAASHVKVLMAGNGGDEVFVGYPTYVADRFLPHYQRMPAWIHERVVRPLVHAIPPSNRRLSWEFKLKQFVNGAGLSPERAHYSWRRIFSPDELAALLEDPAAVHDGFEPFGAHFQRVANVPDSLARAVYCDLKTWLADMALVMFDNVAMAHGVEVRVPLLDHAVVEYVLGLPSQTRFPGGRGKYLLKRAMAGRLPRETLERGKAGFHVPLADWLRGELQDVLLDVLSESSVRRVGGLRPSVIDRLCREHLQGTRDHSWRLWTLMCLVVWHRAFLKRAWPAGSELSVARLGGGPA